MGPVRRLQIAVFAVAVTASCGTPEAEPQPRETEAALVCEDGPGPVFEERIRPLLDEDRPSSCSKCHAASVNIGAFVRDDPCESMNCLVGQGLVNLERPAESKLLEFIERGFEPGEGTGVTDEMVEQEYQGMLDWIEWSAECMATTCSASAQCSFPSTPLADENQPPDEETPDEEPPDEEQPDEEPPPPPDLTLENYPCGSETQAKAFLDWVFPSEGRCGHCHAVDGAIAGVADAPIWIAADENIAGAKETVENIYERGFVNRSDPGQSLLLLKPLHPDYGGVEHGGGSKFSDTEDPLYVAMLQWITLQAECRVLSR